MALSGGPDSVALCALLNKLYPKNRIFGLFVNHNLDSRGVTESDKLVERLFDLFGTLLRCMLRLIFYVYLAGIEGKVLGMQWGTNELAQLTKGQLQERARQKRYQLMLEACNSIGARVLLTGHNQDDDLVTMLYRLNHGSGIDGMAGMKLINPFPVVHPQSDAHFVGHPLLGIPKERLWQTCVELGVPLNADQSNNDMEYQRNVILRALEKMQAANITTREDLIDGLELLKDIRRDIHEQMSPIFSHSLFVNRTIGDATLIIQDDRILRNAPVVSRAINAMVQYTAAKMLPVKTKRMLDVKIALSQALHVNRQEQMKRQAKIYGRAKDTSLTPVDKARRVNMAQMTLGGATVYPMARNDALRRAAIISRMTGKTINNGPAFLIQREPPMRIDNQEAGFLAQSITLAPGELYLWDSRLYISYSCMGADNVSRKFSISYMTVADVRELETLTAGNSLLRRNVYNYMGSTPATHLYQVPVIREFATQEDGLQVTKYIAFPTLRMQYPLDKYQWNTKQAGNTILVSKFQCLP